MTQGLRRCEHCGSVLDAGGRPLDAGAKAEIIARLSDAQRRVLGYLLAGLTEPQIAAKIHRSRHTVHDHTKAIYAATGVKRRVQLVLLLQGLDLGAFPGGEGE